MGDQAACTWRSSGRSGRGIALFEQHDLIVRGDVRLAIPLKEITAARAESGTLVVTWPGGTVELLVGPVAARWADRIANPRSRMDKLGVKPGAAVLLMHVTDDAFVAELASRGARILKRAGRGNADVLFYGAGRREVLAQLPAAVPRIAESGAIWILRPKGRPEITDADVRAAAKHAGLVDVKVVSFSEALTAEKLVIPVAKRSRPGRPASPAPRKRESSASRDRT